MFRNERQDQQTFGGNVAGTDGESMAKKTISVSHEFNVPGEKVFANIADPYKLAEIILLVPNASKTAQVMTSMALALFEG